jgi:hypothetical protein
VLIVRSVLQIHHSFADQFGVSRKPDRAIVAAPAYHDLTARQLHVDVLFKQSESLAGYHSRAGARTASPSLTDTALVYTQIDVLSVDDGHEADVDELWEAFVVLYRRTKIAYRRVCDCRDLQYTVWVAQGQDADVDILTQNENPGSRRIKFRVAHADGHQAIRIDARFDVSSRAFEYELLRRSIMCRQKTGNTANAIATLFDF